MTDAIPTTAPKDWLEEIMGSMMRYQWLITISAFLPKFPIAWHLIAQGVMMPGVTPVYCNTTPFQESQKFTMIDIKKLEKEACSSNCSQILVGKQFYKRSIISDYELYCDKLILRTVAQFLVMAGVFFGCFIFGYLSDKYGRKWPFIIACLVQPPLGLWVAFSPNIYSFLAAKFSLCFFVGGTMLTSFVLFSEIIGKKWRPLMGIAFHYPFVLGHLSLPGLAYLFHEDWRYFQVAISLPSIIFVYFIFVLPESPRWLLATSQVEKSIENLERIAKFNRLPHEHIRAKVLEEMKKMSEAHHVQKNKGTVKDLFKTTFMSFITIGTWMNWLAVTCAYYGMAELASAFTDSFYINNILAAVVQLPAVTLLLWLINVWGRKWSQIATEMCSAVGCFGTVFTPPEYQIIPASIAMFGLAASFPCAYVYAGELFPTIVRTIGTGSASSIGRVGGMASPVFGYLREYGLWIPPLMYALLCALAAVMCFLLPETMGRPLANTVEDVEEWKKKNVTSS